MDTTLLVASAGGHLDELSILARAWGIDRGDHVWVTSRTHQTESMLSGHEVIWLPRIGSGETVKALRGLPTALRIQSRLRPKLVVSTGALFSTPHLAAARILRTETWFVDSATRVDGPSHTARFAQRFTNAHLFAQGTGWGDRRWRSVPTVFDAFESVRTPTRSTGIQSAVVTLGSELWPFDRAISALLQLLPGIKVTWQTGTTEVTDGGRHLTQWVPASELRSSIREADVVIAHAGVGSALVALDEGKIPVILPRQSRHGEMIDDHQVEFARWLAQKGLAVTVDPSGLQMCHLEEAARLRARHADLARDPRWAQMPRPRF